MRITKIISIASLAVLLSVSSTANALRWLPGNFVSGLEVGHVSQSGTLSSTDFTLNAAPVAGEHRQNISDSGTIYGALFGYQFTTCKRYLFGLEGHVNSGHYEHAHNFAVPILPLATNANVWYEKGTSYGVTARIGYTVKPCLTPYVRIGGQVSQDKLFITYTGFSAAPPLFDHFEAKETAWNWLLGVGLEVPLFSKKTNVRFEYDYIPSRQRQYVDTAAPITATHSYGPHAHIVKMQWVWNFMC